MPVVEVTIPDQLHAEIDRLVEDGEFVNREEAMEELVTAGLSAMAGPATADDEVEENPFTQAFDDQRDPAMRGEGSDDEYSF